MAVLNLANGQAEIASALGISNFPFTIAGWVRRADGLSDTGVLVRLGSVGSRQEVDVNASSYLVQLAQYNNGAYDSRAYTGSKVEGNIWTPFVLRVASSSSRELFKGAFANLTTDGTDIGGFDSAAYPIDSFRLGSSSQPFPGQVSHVAVWASDLSDTDVQAFLNGGNPLAIADANLRAYWAEAFFEDTDWYYQDESGNDYHLLLDANAVRYTTTTAPPVDAPPSTATPGIVITDIKEPNESDTLVTGVSNARARVWVGSNDVAEANYELTDETITDGEMTLMLNTSETINDPVIVSVDWDAGNGETKFFPTTGNIIDLDA